jgi:hypothetical protein
VCPGASTVHKSDDAGRVQDVSLFAVLAGAVALCACSVVIGQAVWRCAGFDGWSWLAPPTGLAALVVICLAAVQLPHGRTFAVAAVVAATAAGIVFRPRGPLREPALETTLVMALGVLLASLPFIATGRVGILGVTDNADLSAHLLLADSVGTGHPPVGIDPSWYSSYPTGPHALVATLHAGLGIPIDAGFNALLIATLAIAAATALAVLREAPPGARVIGALVAGIPYLAAFYTIQSSFKETLLGLFVVAWALSLPPVADALARRPQAIIPLGIVAAAAYGDYNFVALAWLAAAAVPYLVYRVARAGSRASPRLSPRAALGTAIFVLILAAIALPLAGQAKTLVGAVKATAAGQTTGGNITSELAAYQIFGLWPSSDGRSFGASLDLMRLLGAGGAAAAAWAVWWWARRRRLELVAAALGAVAIYVIVRSRATPYYSGKALVIAAFPVALMTVGAIVLALPPLRELSGRPLAGRLAALGGVAFLAIAAWSSGLALRAGRVQPNAHRSELLSLRPLLAKGPTLYMGQNDYISWILRGVQIGYPYSYIAPSQVQFDTRGEKPWKISSPYDFDGVLPPQLDRFRFVLASRTPYASSPPPNWHRVRVTRSYEVYERRGPTPGRSVLPEPGAPGAILDCSSPAGAAVGQSDGVAAVRPPPVLVANEYLGSPSGARLPAGEFDFRQISAGQSAIVKVRLPAGTWTISLQYVSPVSLDVGAGPGRGTLPPSLEGPGVFWRAGTLTTRGGIARCPIRSHGLSPLATFRNVLLGDVALTRTNAGDREIPLRKACGRYVDWYAASAA